MIDKTTDSTKAAIALAGRIGWIATLALGVILAVHPLGTTSLYADGAAFLDHVGPFWIAIHLIAGLLLLAWPLVLWTWASTLSDPGSRLLGRWAAWVCSIGMAVGVLHLIATDTTTFVMFRETFEAASESEAALVGVDLLLRLHAATLTAWVTSFWFAVPALLGFACARNGSPAWMTGLAAFAALAQVGALALTFASEQWTTLSETIVFRAGATALIAWFLVTTWQLRGATSSAALH